MAEFSETLNIKMEMRDGTPFDMKEASKRALAELGLSATEEQIQAWFDLNVKLTIEK